jgi:hypothetical protein
MELAYGNIDAAARLARRVLSRNPSYDSQLRAALSLAMSGSGCEAETIANALALANSGHTFINSVLVPIVRAGVELGRGQPTRAIDHLRVVAPYELGFIAALTPIYLRGRSYLMLEDSTRAATEFQRILDHRGSDPFSPFHSVAALGLARAQAMAGDIESSLLSYERFLTCWSKADADVPVLAEAREELARLKSGVVIDA